jgi:hypothetical protein
MANMTRFSENLDNPLLEKPMIQYREIPVSKLTQVSTFPKDRALIASIGRVGLMQPIVVKRHGTGAKATYELVAGRRRARAARTATGRIADAYVLYASRDRFGDADLYVSFLDALSGSPQRASLGDLDRSTVAKMAEAHVMPVCSARASRVESADRVRDKPRLFGAGSRARKAKPCR